MVRKKSWFLEYRTWAQEDNLCSSWGAMRNHSRSYFVKLMCVCVGWSRPNYAKLFPVSCRPGAYVPPQKIGCTMAMSILHNLVIAIHQNNSFRDSSNALVFSPQFDRARDRFPSPAHTSTLGTGCVIRGTHQKTGANIIIYQFYHP